MVISVTDIDFPDSARLQELIDATVPAAIKRPPMDLGPYNQGFTESEFLDKFKCAPHATASRSQGLSQGVPAAQMAVVNSRSITTKVGQQLQRAAPITSMLREGRLSTAIILLQSDSVSKWCAGSWRPRTRS